MVVHSESNRRCAGDGGAMLVEAALVSPLLFYLIFGIVEYGGFFRDYLTVGNGLRAGSRTAAIWGNDAEADYHIVQAVKAETLAIRQVDIERVIVFKATKPSSTPPYLTTAPTSCLLAPAPGFVSGTCNIYAPSRDWNPPGATTAQKAAHYGCSGGDNWAAGWCPISRFSAATAGGTPVSGPPDYVGVHIVVSHMFATGLFGTSKDISDSAISQIEPKSQV